jgi:hypothetical protein
MSKQSDLLNLTDAISVSGTNVGIGTTSPLGKLHVKTADSGATVDASADDLVIEGSGNTGMTILSGASNTGSIYFGDSGTNWDGYIAYSQSTRSMTLGVAAGGGTLRIDSAGRVTMPYQPSFAASISTGTVPIQTFIICDLVRHNIGGHYNSTTGVFTAPVAGRYVITTIFMCNDDSTYANRQYTIRINGSTYNHSYSSGGPSNVHHAFHWSGVISLSQSDSVSLYNDNIPLYGSGSNFSHFSGYLIG